MNSEASSPSPTSSPENRKPSREHKRYISLGGAGDDDDDDDVFGSNKPARDVVRKAEEARCAIPRVSEDGGRRAGEGSKVVNIGSPAGSEETLRTPREGRKWWRKGSFHCKEEEGEMAVERGGGTTLSGPRAMPRSPPPESSTADLGTTIIDLAPGYTTRLTGDGRPRSPSKLGPSRMRKKRQGGNDAEDEGKRDSVASGGWRRDSMIDEELDGRESWEANGNGMDWMGRGRREGRESLYDARGFLKEGVGLL